MFLLNAEAQRHRVYIFRESKSVQRVMFGSVSFAFSKLFLYAFASLRSIGLNQYSPKSNRSGCLPLNGLK